MALIVLVAGVLWLNPVRDNLVLQREAGLVAEAHLISNVFEAQLPLSAPINMITGDGIDVVQTLAGLKLSAGVEVFVYDAAKVLVASTVGQTRSPVIAGVASDGRNTVITDFLNAIWETLSGIFASNQPLPVRPTIEQQVDELLPQALGGETMVRTGVHADGGTVFFVAAPIMQGATAVGVVVVSSPSGEIDELVRSEREQVLQMFVIAILVSIGLSLVLASTIANPLSDLAAAAEFGGTKTSRKKSPARVRIPDLSGRPDEIGRLSGAMRGMVGALYDRIDSNEQFAADVAHEIKNPLASLRSAVGTLRVAKRDDQRERLLEVIEHDVRRLDRLVSDISNASPSIRPW